MIKKSYFKLICFLIGFFSGIPIALRVLATGLPAKWIALDFDKLVFKLTFIGIFGIIFGLILLLFVSLFIKWFDSMSKNWVTQLRSISIPKLVTYVVALILSFILAALLCNPIYRLQIPEFLKTILTVLIYVGLGYISLMLINSKYPELEAFFKGRVSLSALREGGADSLGKGNAKSKRRAQIIPKVLDTSVIIDGRIYDILDTGFIDGPIVIPGFVLNELQHIADSADDLKRVRGRRGLDVLNRIQKELPLEIVISEKNYPEIAEVDSKLLKLAKDMKGKVVTNDYNLNKVAKLRGVEVLNTNDLANAVKTVVIPGEELSVTILKEGKEHNQGIAYLNDGTMIVVEEGRSLIGQRVTTEVTSVLQTSAGKMIFVKPVRG